MKKIFTIICLVIICCNVSAQETYNKDFAISVKKNSEYFYGEASDAETAFNKLLKKIKSCNDFDSPIDTTAAGARQKSKHFEYQKNSKTNVTIYYVLKKNLVITENADSQVIAGTDSKVPDENAPVIDFVLSYNNYQDLRQYLDKRKNERHDIQFKLIKGDDGTRNCYWIVFDGTRKVIAVLDKTLTKDLMTGESVDPQKYKNYPKIWLQTF